MSQVNITTDDKIYVNRQILGVSKEEILKKAEGRPKALNYMLNINDLTHYSLLTYEQCTERVLIYIKHALYNEFVKGQDYLIELVYGRTQYVNDIDKSKYGKFDIDSLINTLISENWNVKLYNDYFSPKVYPSYVIKITE